jgi:hypothetical protein
MDSRKQLQAQAVNQTSPRKINSQASDMIHERRSANYKPNIWKHDYLQSLTSIYDVRIITPTVPPILFFEKLHFVDFLFSFL